MELDSLFDKVHEQLLELFPEAATRLGDHRHDHLLSDPGPSGRARYRSVVEELRRGLDSHPVAAMSRRSRITSEVCRHWAETEIDGFAFDHHLLGVVDPFHGFQVFLPYLLLEMPRRTLSDCERCLERLSRAAVYIDRAIESARAGLRAGLVQTGEAAERVLFQLDQQLSRPAMEHPLLRAFRDLPPELSPEARSRLEDAALRLVERETLPALARFRDALRAEYLPRARRAAGLGSLPGGADLYRWLVRRSTTRPLEPGDVHRLGLSELERIRGEMERVTARRGSGESPREVLAALRADPRSYHATGEELLAGYRRIAERALGRLPRYFGRLPRLRFEVCPIPDFAAAGNVSAFYRRPAADGSRPARFLANIHDPSTRPRYEMEATTLHETVPGHHLQIALQLEDAAMPRLRSSWLHFQAFSEGWALYAERLGTEMGFYEDPASDLGRLSYEMWRAARLVVDTGMHELGWSRARAAECLSSESGLHPERVESEVDRYAVWPAQALSYKVGELTILDLRSQAESALGSRFDLRDFHDAVLEEGSMPLDLLRARMRRWTEERAAGLKKPAG